PEFERGARTRGKVVQKRIEHREVLLRARWQLKEQRAEVVAERAGHSTEGGDERSAVPQPAVVRDPTGRLERQLVGRGRLRCPSADKLLGRHPVEGVIDLDGRKPG